MPHATPLITTLVTGLGLAFLLALLAHRLRLPLIVGYLAAGVVIGPFTPGYVADPELAGELAEIGIILLMFGVGLHFKAADLLAVRATAVPGALLGMAVGTLAGLALSRAMGWPLGAGLIFGLALSVTSTVVLLRALQEHGLVATERGRLAVGWLVVEDVAMVLALVAIPAVAGAGTGTGGLALALLLTVAKVALFVALLLVVGRRLIPIVLHRTAHLHSRELFRLSVLAIALGVAYGASRLFGVSFALGAFMAGLVMATSTLSQQAARETLPLRDAFAVLFFVSVGMLFDPWILWERPLAVLATVLAILLVKPLAAYAFLRLAGHGEGTALAMAAALGQIGEFSFILVALGLSLGLLPPEGGDLVVAGAILSIALNPAIFAVADRRIAAEQATGLTPS